MHRVRARVVVVGDEVLDGFVADANAGWLAQRLRSVGVALDRVAIVPDDVEAIAAEVRAGLAAPRPSIVITTGGVGGTWDDVTYEGVALALDVPLVVAPELATPVREVIDWTVSTGYRLDEQSVAGMMRIATVPEGSTVRLLHRWLAGVYVELDGGPGARSGTAVVMLPGPPGHLRTVVDELVVPEMLGGGRSPLAVAEVPHEYPETLLVGHLARIRARHPEVKVGSYPGRPMIVRFVGARREVAGAAADLRSVLADIAANPATAAVRDAWLHSPAWSAGGG
jgi:nicotinamide-nucleotide amidase